MCVGLTGPGGRTHVQFKLCGKAIEITTLLVTGPMVLAETRENKEVKNKYNINSGVEIYLKFDEEEIDAIIRGRQSSKTKNF